MQITKNFSLDELTHSTTAVIEQIENIPGPKEIENLKTLAVNVLQPIRDEVNIPIKSISGYRCPKLNDHVGGEDDSQHVKGEAADIVPAGITAFELYLKIKALVKAGKLVIDQCIYEKRNIEWVHVSFTNRRKNRNQFMTAKFIRKVAIYTEDNL